MNAIIRGTTPTITFKFDTVDPANITEAFITIKSVNDLSTAIVQNSLATANVTADSISWELSQTDTFKLTAGDTVNVYCDWKEGTTRGRSRVATCRVFETGKDEVI